MPEKEYFTALLKSKGLFHTTVTSYVYQERSRTMEKNVMKLSDQCLLWFLNMVRVFESKWTAGVTCLQNQGVVYVGEHLHKIVSIKHNRNHGYSHLCFFYVQRGTSYELLIPYMEDTMVHFEEYIEPFLSDIALYLQHKHPHMCFKAAPVLIGQEDG